MKKQCIFAKPQIIFLAPWLFVCLMSYPADCATYQLIGEPNSEVQGDIIYDLEVAFNIPDVGLLNCLGNATPTDTGYEIVEEYLTVASETTYNVSSCTPSVPSFSFTIKTNSFLTSDYLVTVRQETDEDVKVVWNDDPWEMVPVWIADSDINRHIGHGEYKGESKIYPYDVWYGYLDNYITFVGLEEITVGVGTFNCIVIDLRSEYHEDSGSWGYTEERVWVHPLGLPIKTNGYEYDAPVGEPTIEGTTIMELSWTDIEAIIATDKEEIDFGKASNSENFQVWNNGLPALHYDISVISGNSYFSILPPTSGSSADSTVKNTHTVVVNRNNIPAGQEVFGEVMISAAGADNSPHYISLSAVGAPPDLNGDGIINSGDFGILAFHWMDDTCSEPNWCEKSDCDHSGTVDSNDLAILCSYWLKTIEDPSLIGHWTMDDDANNMAVLDSSFNGNHGTAQENTSILHTDGIVGGALTFNGSSDYIDCGDVSNLDFGTGDFSICMWMKTSSSVPMRLVNKRDASNIGYEISTTTSGQIRAGIGDSSGYTQGFGGTVNDDAWHHVAITYDRDGSVSLYVDAGIPSTGDISLRPGSIDNSESFRIGRLRIPDKYFDGTIDDVMIFDRVLSLTEVEDLYNASGI